MGETPIGQGDSCDTTRFSGTGGYRSKADATFDEANLPMSIPFQRPGEDSKSSMARWHRRARLLAPGDPMIRETDGDGMGANQFKINVEAQAGTTEDVVVVRVSGEVDILTSPALGDQLRSVTDQGHPSVVVDLGEVTFLDSTGLSVLIAGLKRCEAAGGQLYLTSPRPNVRKVLEITGLTDVFHVGTANDVPG